MNKVQNNNYIINYPDGSVFEGILVNENGEGIGTIKYANGDFYNGDIINHVIRNGNGSMFYKDLNKVYKSKWELDKPVKDYKTKSVTIKNQGKNGTCWAHATTRSFIRTLQILDIIKSQYNEQFYLLFFTILTKNKSCNTGGNTTSFYYLLDYLKNNYTDEIFNIRKNNINCNYNYNSCEINDDINPILNISNPDKIEFIDDLKYLFDNNLLFIFIHNYKVNMDEINKPTKCIRLMLDYKLQPFVGIKISNYLKTHIFSKKNFFIESLSDNDFKCVSESGHAVNLRRWNKNKIEFKNSWGTHSANDGNFFVSDLKYITCGKKQSIVFSVLVFDYNKLNLKFKQRVNNNRCNYFDSIDKSLEINIDEEIILYDDNGFFYSGYKEYTYPNGDIYKGNWNGKPNGSGIMEYINHDKYSGYWLSGNMNGKGTIKYANGDVYSGDWVNNEKNGKGTIKYANGDVYSGDWINNKKNGKGIIKYINGDEYSGDWEDNEKNGKGTLKYINGNEYSGDWKDNEKNGKGIMVYVSGSEYSGDWVNGKKNGKGIMYLLSGNIYDGDFVNEKPNGKGIMKYTNGDEYTGDWVDGKQNGKGILKYTNGDEYFGNWIDGNRIEKLNSDNQTNYKNKYLKYKTKYIRLIDKYANKYN